MESGEEDDAFTMGEREWQKMNRNLSKQGYRDGKSDGREKGMQASFDTALSVSLKHSLKLGQLQGLIEWSISMSSSKSQKGKLELLVAKVTSHLNSVKAYDCPTQSLDNRGSTDIESWTTFLHELINEFVVIMPEHKAIVSCFEDGD